MYYSTTRGDLPCNTKTHIFKKVDSVFIVLSLEGPRKKKFRELDTPLNIISNVIEKYAFVSFNDPITVIICSLTGVFFLKK